MAVNCANAWQNKGLENSKHVQKYGNNLEAGSAISGQIADAGNSGQKGIENSGKSGQQGVEENDRILQGKVDSSENKEQQRKRITQTLIAPNLNLRPSWKDDGKGTMASKILLLVRRGKETLLIVYQYECWLVEH